MIILTMMLAIICVFGIALFQNGVSKQKNRVFIVFAFAIMFLFQALRGETVGADTPAYINGFYKITQIANSWEKRNWELGYVLLNRIVGYFSDSPQILLAAVSAVILGFSAYFIAENTDNDESSFWPVFFFITLNHFLTAMVSLRQYSGLAIGINIYTVLRKDLSLKAYFKAFALLILAFLFHRSALVCGLIICLFWIKNIDRRTVLLVCAACVVVFVFFDSFLQIGFKIFPEYYDFATSNHPKYAGMEWGGVYTVFLLLKIILTMFVFMLCPRLQDNKELYRLLVLVLIGAGISLMTTKVGLIWRFGYYFDIFLILLIPKVLKRVRDVGLAGYSICFLGGWGYYLFCLYTNNSRCVPYYMFWQHRV